MKRRKIIARVEDDVDGELEGIGAGEHEYGCEVEETTMVNTKSVVLVLMLMLRSLPQRCIRYLK